MSGIAVVGSRSQESQQRLMAESNTVIAACARWAGKSKGVLGEPIKGIVKTPISVTGYGDGRNRALPDLLRSFRTHSHTAAAIVLDPAD